MQQQTDVVEIGPTELAALELFQGVGTQWRYRGGITGPELPCGLDYPGVRASPAFRLLPRATREGTFADLCILEREYIVARAEFVRQRTGG